MWNQSIRRRTGHWLLAAALLGVGFASGVQAAEPTINQIYEAAQAGKLDQAQSMVQQVLVAHPNSAKAHFVKAELSARQGQLSRAREALADAERLAPGLPFAKPEAVQSLRAQLAAKASPPSPSARTATAPAPAAPASSFPLGLGLALGGGAIALAIFMLRRKPAPTAAPMGPAYAGAAGAGGLSGPQAFGMGGGAMAPAYGQPGYGQPGYGQPAYGQPGYGQPQGSGMGGRLMGGLATGLAVGAGVMAAQAIGKSLSGNDDHAAHRADAAPAGGYEPIANNPNADLGGQNFGLNDTSAWDDGNAFASGGDGSGDWDT